MGDCFGRGQAVRCATARARGFQRITEKNKIGAVTGLGHLGSVPNIVTNNGKRGRRWGVESEIRDQGEKRLAASGTQIAAALRKRGTLRACEFGVRLLTSGAGGFAGPWIGLAHALTRPSGALSGHTIGSPGKTESPAPAPAAQVARCGLCAAGRQHPHRVAIVDKPISSLLQL